MIILNIVTMSNCLQFIHKLMKSPGQKSADISNNCELVFKFSLDAMQRNIESTKRTFKIE